MAEETFTHGNKRQLKVENDNCEMLQEGPTWPGMDGGGGQKYGLLNRGSAILKWATFIADT